MKTVEKGTSGQRVKVSTGWKWAADAALRGPFLARARVPRARASLGEMISRFLLRAFSSAVATFYCTHCVYVTGHAQQIYA